MSGSVVLSCPVVAGDPPPDITWLKNDSVVQLTDRAYQLTNGSLVISDVTVRSMPFQHLLSTRADRQGADR